MLGRVARWLAVRRAARDVRIQQRVLAFLAQHPGRSFGGADIMMGAKVPAGVMYVALQDLQAAGLVSAQWEELQPGQVRPRRRLYHVTPVGSIAYGRQQGTPDR